MFVSLTAFVRSSLSSISESGKQLELLYWTGILIALLLALGIIALVLRKFMKGRRDTVKLDTDFLEGIREKLSPDEMRRVRESALRKMAEEESKRKKEYALSIEDLESIAKGKKPLAPLQGDKGAVPPAGAGRMPAPQSPKPAAAPPAPQKPAPPKPAPSKPAPTRPVPSRPTPAPGRPPVGQAGAPPKKAPPVSPPASLPTRGSDAKRVSSGKVQYYADLGDVGPKKVVTSLEDILVSRRKAEQKTPPEERVVPPETEAAQKMKPVDVKMLLERGLITQQEFDRLKGYFKKEEEKE